MVSPVFSPTLAVDLRALCDLGLALDGGERKFAFQHLAKGKPLAQHWPER